MADHILCITAAGGIPLLSRTKQGSSPIPFPVVGSLYGVHMFGLNRDVSLKNLVSENYRIVWKSYHDSIILIAVAQTLDYKNKVQVEPENKTDGFPTDLEIASQNSASTITDDHLIRVLDNVFNSLVLLTGLNELQNIQNADRLKKDLKSCYQLIDTFLDVDTSKRRKRKLFLFGDLTHCVDVILNPESKVLEDHLQAFLEATNSQYGCLVFNGKLLCATEKWRQLDGQELALLARLISILPPSITSCDIPVYLPQVSPNVAYRLLIFTLVVGNDGGMRACALCGPEPSLTHIEDKFIDRFWGPAASTLQKCCISNDIPAATKAALPSEMLGFLLVDTERRGCTSYLSPLIAQESGNKRKQQKQTNTQDLDWIYDKLVEFYKYTVGTTFLGPEQFETGEDFVPEPHVGLAHYRCMKKYKCFALIKSCYQIFALYAEKTPTFALQGLTEHIFDTLVKDRLI